MGQSTETPARSILAVLRPSSSATPIDHLARARALLAELVALTGPPAR